MAALGLTALLSGGSVAFAQETQPEQPILTGWVQDEKTQEWSYYLEDGTAVKASWKKIGEYFFYFDRNGNMVHDDWIDGFYLRASGVMVTNGWIQGKESKQWYYFDEEGNYLRDRWKTIQGKDYYFLSSGKMAEKTWIGDYYLNADGTMAVNQWVWDEANRVWYYTLEDGRYARESWVQIEDQWYHFRKGGLMDRNLWLGDYYLNADGAMAVDQWVWDETLQSWYYTLADGRYARASWLNINDAWYHFQTYGQMDRDTWIGDYYVAGDGKMAAAQWIWSVPDSDWFYVDENGRYYSEKWLPDNEKYYYFERYGNMARNRWIGDYYVADDGVMATSQTIGGRYFVDETGRYRKSAYIWTPFYSQIPDAVSGCEAYSLTQGLHAIGKATHVTPFTMTTYVPQSPNGDPRNGFAGSQYSVYSLGGLVSTIYPAPLTPLAQYYAPNSEDTTGYSVDQLKAELVKGNTVVVWATSGYFADPYMVHQWFGWEPTNPHVMTLHGFDDDTMYISDPTYGHYTVSLSRFSYVYNTRGKMSITLRK
ncbi:MAG: C39 family peptidase [Eubacteriales bacterium]|nr:C39 family peptidase [Eubacteriales bacterium]